MEISRCGREIQWDAGEIIKCEQNSVISKANAFVRGLDGSFTPWYSTTKELYFNGRTRNIEKNEKTCTFL